VHLTEDFKHVHSKLALLGVRTRCELHKVSKQHFALVEFSVNFGKHITLAFEKGKRLVFEVDALENGFAQLFKVIVTENSSCALVQEVLLQENAAQAGYFDLLGQSLYERLNKGSGIRGVFSFD